jgi:HEPN domain-containing protein
VILIEKLDELAQARLGDAEALRGAARYDGALYLCGYAVELALKARICRVLDWSGFPSTSNEFSGATSLKTHDLDVLLKFSGQERRIKSGHFEHWNVVASWKPEVRYSAIGSVSSSVAERMIASARILIGEL